LHHSYEQREAQAIKHAPTSRPFCRAAAAGHFRSTSALRTAPFLHHAAARRRFASVGGGAAGTYERISVQFNQRTVRVVVFNFFVRWVQFLLMRICRLLEPALSYVRTPCGNACGLSVLNYARERDADRYRWVDVLILKRVNSNGSTRLLRLAI
jgi:hypothetical protein